MEPHHDILKKALRVLAIAVWAGIILYAFFHRNDFTLESILGYTPEDPLLAAVVLLVLFALKSLTVFLYSGLLYAASGILFPLPAALLLNICGTVVMALAPYLLARSVGAARADELRERYPRLKRFEAMRSRNGLGFVVFLRCINIVNFDVGSMYCGAVRLAPASFLAGSILGKLTDIAALSIMGASLEDRRAAPFLIALAVDLSIAAIVLIWSKKHTEKENNT